MSKEIKKMLLDIDKNQTWLFRKLRKNGYPTLPYCNLNKILNGIITSGYANDVKMKCIRIIKEYQEGVECGQITAE